VRPSCVDVLGRVVETTKCRPSSLNGVRGVVVGDRRNVLEILTQEGSRIIVPKEACWLYVYYDNCVRMIYGVWIIGYRDVRLHSRKCMEHVNSELHCCGGRSSSRAHEAKNRQY